MSIAMADGTIGERHDLQVGDVVLLSAGPQWRAEREPVRATVEKVEGTNVTARGDVDGTRHLLSFGSDAPPEFGYHTLRPPEAFTVNSQWEGYDAGMGRWRHVLVLDTRPETDIGEHGTLPPSAKFRFLDGIGYHGQVLAPDEDPGLAEGYLLLPAPLATIRRWRAPAELVTDDDVAAWRRGAMFDARDLTDDEVRAGIVALDRHREERG